jgi:hypothetical protein
MKKHGRHRKRYGTKQQARFFAHELNQSAQRADVRLQNKVKGQASDRRAMLRGWLRVMSKEEVRARVVAIYGEASADELEFLQ